MKLVFHPDPDDTESAPVAHDLVVRTEFLSEANTKGKDKGALSGFQVLRVQGITLEARETSESRVQTPLRRRASRNQHPTDGVEDQTIRHHTMKLLLLIMNVYISNGSRTKFEGWVVHPLTSNMSRASLIAVGARMISHETENSWS